MAFLFSRIYSANLFSACQGSVCFTAFHTSHLSISYDLLLETEEKLSIILLFADLLESMQAAYLTDSIGGKSIMSDLLSYTIQGEPFMLFSVSHLVALALFVLSVLALYLLRDRLRTSVAEKRVRYSLAGLLLFTEAAFQVWHVYTGSWSAAYTLPLQLCSISLLFSIAMLMFKSYRIYEFTYFLGLGGALQAMLTPELFYPFPHFRFFHFFLAHAAIILACLYMTWVAEYRPTIRSYWKALGVLNLLLPIVLLANSVTGGNYMFVSQKPANPSLLDYLGPYPWYILSLEGVAALLFFLLYLPFYAQSKRDRKPSQPGASV